MNRSQASSTGGSIEGSMECKPAHALGCEDENPLLPSDLLVSK